MSADFGENERRAVRRERILPPPLAPLERLAWNYWWSWAADGTAIFRDLDPQVWEDCEHNPRRLLNEISEFRIMQMATDPIYCSRVGDLAARFDEYIAQPRRWSSPSGKSISPANPVAYFCAEFGIHHSLPLYSGGLGILAGDHLKSASDLNMPLVAIGLLYRFGYFRQRLTREGWQEEYYGETNPSQLFMRYERDERGEPVSIDMEIRGRNVHARVWRIDVGRVPLFLLDTNVSENEEMDRWITGHLYGGDRETRVVQEMMLGIGGVRLLRKLKIEPSVFHLNEGHSAFLTLELVREMVATGEYDFDDAQRVVRRRCAFTTHTPVAAGNDEFDPALIEKCFGHDFAASLGLDDERLLAMGRVQPDNSEERFGLTPLAIRMCRSTNGVSEKHGEVSRELWKEMWSDKIPVCDIPITSVTNGVHAPTWVAPLLRDLFERYVGRNWSEVARDADRWREGIERISDEELWSVHRLLKRRLVAFIRHRSYHSRVARAESEEYTQAARTAFDPEALTIGFARRIAAYKRWSLLLTDPERLRKMFVDEERPVQFVFAGKAHPQDQGAKVILQQLTNWKYDPLVMQRAVFLQDYDQEIARQLVQSVDVWMNVPRRPLEASGTSGEKVAMNGGLNLSVLDGWWIEGCDGENGWAIGETCDQGADIDIDACDAASLYRTIEEEVIPRYYDRDAGGIPRRWVAMMKHALVTLVPKFNSDRMVEEYAERIYCGK